MHFNVAINGYGRIGQSVLRAIYSTPYRSKFNIRAVNDPADIETLTYLTRYDTTHGRFPYSLDFQGDTLSIGDDSIKILNIEDPAQLPWKELDIDLVFECSGSFADRQTADLHIQRGAKRLLISHPATREVDATIVYGFNEELIQKQHTVISSASCTTNCIVPVLDILNRELKITNGVTTTVHSVMNDQPLIDCHHNTNLRLTRSALHSIIPVDTGLARGINRLLPQFEGRFECLHLRVPTINVSVMDIAINVEKPTTVEEVNGFIRTQSLGRLKEVLGYTEEPHASVDFNGDARSTVVDGSQTKVCGQTLVKMLCWFDNEWAYANRMLDVANRWLSL